MAYKNAAINELRQTLYDFMAGLPESERGQMFSRLNEIGFAEVPENTDTYWAEKALIQSGGDQDIYDSIMMANPEYRADEFLLWATLNYDKRKYQSDFNIGDHWAAKAYMIGTDNSQSNYDFIQGAGEGSAKWIELAN